MRVAHAPNRLSPLRFVVAFGVVSLLADVVYEGSRAIVGPYLATFGASAAVVGVVTGAGEAVALVLRLFTGRLSDRTGRHWALSIAGYLITIVAVPVLAAVQTLWQAASLVVAERFGKAVRTPARDTMLAQAATDMGRGWAFGLHEALDQSGALLGPLVVAGMVAVSGYRLGFAVLAVPGALAIAALFWLRAQVPVPAGYERTAADNEGVIDDAGPDDTGPEVTGLDDTAERGNAASLGNGAGTGKTTGPDGAAGPADPRGSSTAPAFSGRFWLYTAFTAVSMAGFATFGVLSYHMTVRHVLSDALIPVTYAVAMGAAALAALVFGRLYDRVGLRGLVAAPLLALPVPLLSFSTTPALVWAGALVWGAALGIHESTLRAAVPDLVPAARRGAGYGTFTAAYGLAWLAGGALIGVLYDRSISAAVAFGVAAQILALLTFVPLAAQRSGSR